MSRATPRPRRRLIITVCSKEAGAIVLPVERGSPRRRLDARAILRELQALVTRRNLDAVVLVREGCAGGCHGRGPNVSLTVHAIPAPGERPDNVAIGWRTYVGALADAPSLQAILDENLIEWGAQGAPQASHREGRRSAALTSLDKAIRSHPLS